MSGRKSLIFPLSFWVIRNNQGRSRVNWCWCCCGLMRKILRLDREKNKVLVVSMGLESIYEKSRSGNLIVKLRW